MTPTEFADPGELTVTTSLHIGPLPSADTFRAYKDAHEPAGQWILDEAARNAEHIREIELIATHAQSRDMLLARLFPFGVVIFFIVAAIVLAGFNIWVGTAAFFSTFSSVVIAYLRSSRAPPDNPASDSPAQKTPTHAPPPPRL